MWRQSRSPDLMCDASHKCRDAQDCSKYGMETLSRFPSSQNKPPCGCTHLFEAVSEPAGELGSQTWASLPRGVMAVRLVPGAPDRWARAPWRWVLHILLGQSLQSLVWDHLSM